MIEIIDQVLDITKKVVGTAYRAYPLKLLKGKQYAIVTPQGRSVQLTDGDGNEMQVRLTYGITIFSDNPEKIDDIFQLLTTNFNNIGLQSSGYSPSYQIDMQMYTANAVYTALVDNRGCTYR